MSYYFQLLKKLERRVVELEKDIRIIRLDIRKMDKEREKQKNLDRERELERERQRTREAQREFERETEKLRNIWRKY